jgi:dihydrofolate reductase
VRIGACSVSRSCRWDASSEGDPAEALDTARQAAGDLDVRIGGGPVTIRQFLAADLIDHLHIVVAPIVLGPGPWYRPSMSSFHKNHGPMISGGSGGTFQLIITNPTGLAGSPRA